MKVIQNSKQTRSKRSNNTENLNIRRINTTLVNAKINDRDEVLKEFLIAKGIFDGTKPIEISDIKTLTFDELNNVELITVSYIPNLIELNISGTLVDDLNCLSILQDLKHLDISNTPVENIEGLKEIPLKTLILSGTEISDSSHIGKINTLEYLDISKCNVNDITSFKNLENLVHLDISDTKISDLSPIYKLNKIKKIKHNNSAVVTNSDNIELILRTR